MRGYSLSYFRRWRLMPQRIKKLVGRMTSGMFGTNENLKKWEFPPLGPRTQIHCSWNSRCVLVTKGCCSHQGWQVFSSKTCQVFSSSAWVQVCQVDHTHLFPEFLVDCWHLRSSLGRSDWVSFLDVQMRIWNLWVRFAHCRMRFVGSVIQWMFLGHQLWTRSYNGDTVVDRTHTDPDTWDLLSG